MDFSLSSSLVGNAVSNPDKLALDLQFATDKTLTARRGPTPVFTRGSTGRFVGNNGLIQSAAINAPRFDHDPVTGVCKGLLMEESRTNICLQSENLSTTWGGLGRTISSDFATSPDGSTTADKIVENTSNGLHGVFQTPTTVSGSTYIGSMYVKAAGRNFAMIYTGAAPTNGRYISIPADGTGTVLGLFNANPSTVTLQYVGNGWYRVTILIVASGTGTSLEIYAAITGTNASYTGDGTSGISVWGAQVELGSFATSYIPTTTASVVRSADVCSITGSDFSGFYNQPEGTLFADVTPQTVAQASVVLAVNTGTFQNAHLIYKVDQTINAVGRRWAGQTSVGATAQTSIATSTDVAIARSRLSYAYKLNDFVFAYAGGIVGTDNLGNIPSPTAMRIGGRDDGLSINGHIAAVRYYKKRLSNARIQTITV